MKVSTLKVLIIFFVILSFSNCAKRGRPTGGPKDSIPPLLVHAIPTNKTLHFKSDKIKLLFDEYIKLKDVSKQLIVSPPLANNPIISPVGSASKFITIKLLDTLKKNTTYTFNFGNSIQDNNEGNALARFKYVISTGDYIDSLKVKGTIFDAFKEKTDENIAVLLYQIDSTFNDSIIYKQKPTYVTSTIDTTQNFELENIKAGTYLLMALKQENLNYIYQPKTNKIGFYKNLIQVPADTSYSFPIFKEILPFKVFKPKELSKGHIIIGFQGSKKNLSFEPLTPTLKNSAVSYLDEKKDTIHFWFSKFEGDSLSFKIKNENEIDTVYLKLHKKDIDSLKVSVLTRATLDLRDTFAIKTNVPIIKIDTSLISIKADSIRQTFNPILNSSKTKLYLNFNKNVDTKYRIEILPNAIQDIFENKPDTLKYTINTKNVDSYGIINLKVTNVQSPIIIQLLSKAKKLVAVKKTNEDKLLKFSNLVPDTYQIRAIIDKNNNGTWDTGNYLKRIYPEKVIYFEKELNVRANWELNEIFKIN
ncbi:MAG: Ig-like domain-containing protein [Lutibacter sp.]